MSELKVIRAHIMKCKKAYEDELEFNLSDGMLIGIKAKLELVAELLEEIDKLI